MISNTKLCALVVMLCVITPLSVGFLWPASEGMDTIHEIGPSVNITDDLYNDTTLLFDDYANYYRNNMFIYDRDSGATSTHVSANSASSVPSSIPDIYGGIQVLTTEEYFSTRPLTVPSFIGWCNNLVSDSGITGDYILTLSYLNNPELDEWYMLEDVGLAIIVQYDSMTDKITWTDTGGVPHIISEDVALTFYALYTLMDFVPGDRTIYVTVAASSNFVDLTEGFSINTGGELVDWENGYDNVGIDIMIKTASNLTLTLTPWKHIQNVSATVSITSGEISLIANGETKVLGSSSSYPYVVFSIDTSAHTCSLYGLTNIDEFGSWKFAVLSVVTIDNVPFADYDGTPMFNKVLMETGAQDVDFLVVNALAGLMTVPASNDASIDLKGFYPGDSQVQLTGVQQFGQYLKIYVNGSLEATGQTSIVKDLTIFDKTFELNGLLITVIDKDIYINGEPVYSSNSEIRELRILLDGVWLTNAHYSKITDAEVPTYSWGLINFGLDQSGFCICGLLTASGSGIAAMLAGRRSGSKTALVSLTAICCAAVYLTLLMAA